MELEELLKILKAGENAEVECKESYFLLPISLWESYSAFANTNGGIIILGILEKKDKTLEVSGIENVNNILKSFWDLINNKKKVSVNILKNDDVKVVKIEEQDIIVINVPRANRIDRPVYIDGNPMTGTYKRFHEGDYHATNEEIKVMFGDATSTAKDLIEIEEYSIDDIDRETFEDYRKSFKIHNGDNHKYNKLSDEEFLYTLNVVNRESKKLTMAGLLMFGKERDIVRILPSYFLDYREIKKFEAERWSHRIVSSDTNWSGNVWGFFSKIVNRLTSDIEIPFALDKNMQRIDDTDVHKSVREALSNSLVHADYRESGTIVVIKGENYFKFANPGNLRIPLERAMLGGQSDPRNPTLHTMFAYLGYGEKAGSGLPMIISVWNEKDWVSPKIEEVFNPNRTTLELYMADKFNDKNSFEVQKEIIKETETDYKEQILDIIKNNNGITRKDLVDRLKYTPGRIKYFINILKLENKIISRGNKKSTTYYIK
jgi:predicted HTH transcriptional regulator